MSLIAHVEAEQAYERLRFVKPPKWVPARWTTVLDDTCKTFGLTRDQLAAPSRYRSIAWPRFYAMAKMRELGMSYPDVGRRLGGMDHTSVIHGVRRYAMPQVQAYLTRRALEVSFR